MAHAHSRPDLVDTVVAPQAALAAAAALEGERALVCGGCMANRLQQRSLRAAQELLGSTAWLAPFLLLHSSAAPP